MPRFYLRFYLCAPLGAKSSPPRSSLLPLLLSLFLYNLYFAIFFVYLLAPLSLFPSASCHFFAHHYVCFVLTLAQSIKSVPSANSSRWRWTQGTSAGSRVGAAAARVVAGGGVRLDTVRNEKQLEQCATWRYILNSTTVN